MWLIPVLVVVFVLGIAVAWRFSQPPRPRTPLTRVLAEHDRIEADLRRRDQTGDMEGRPS